MERPLESLVGVNELLSEPHGACEVGDEESFSMSNRTLTLRLNMSVTVSGIFYSFCSVRRICSESWVGVVCPVR